MLASTTAVADRHSLPLLTVDYSRLRVRQGDRLLDLGCGGGRHAYEAMRRGAAVVAVDANEAEVVEVAGWTAAMSQDEMTAANKGSGFALAASALDLPFADETFDRVIAAEVLEHIPEDQLAMSELARVLRPGGTLAVTVPRWWPEKICWALSVEYHDRPGGHIRIYRRDVLVQRLSSVGLVRYGSHHAHSLHSAYWWLKCAVGVDDDSHPLVRAYHRLLVWDITAGTPFTRVPERVLNPIVGKSTVVYFNKPAGLERG